MKTFISMIMTVAIIALTSCQTNTTDNASENSNETSTSVKTVKDYVDDNTFIDVDVTALVNNIAAPDSRTNVTADDNNKMKAAVYRFYKHVALKDGFYTLDINDGAEINVSTTVFSALKENLDHINDFIKQAKEKGDNIEISVPDEEYLNSLLQ